MVTKLDRTIVLHSAKTRSATFAPLKVSLGLRTFLRWIVRLKRTHVDSVTTPLHDSFALVIC